LHGGSGGVEGEGGEGALDCLTSTHLFLLLPPPSVALSVGNK